MNETQPLPTDAELAAFTASAEWAAYETPMLVDFARAVLAKWGTPAPVGVEPVAVIRYERSTQGRENEMPRVVSCNWMPDGVYEVFAAPQVLAMGRGPLTTDQLGPDPIFRAGARFAEDYHGIKQGGQHGIE